MAKKTIQQWLDDNNIDLTKKTAKVNKWEKEDLDTISKILKKYTMWAVKKKLSTIYKKIGGSRQTYNIVINDNLAML